MAGQNDVARKKVKGSYRHMVANMIPAPQYGTITDFNEGLNGIVFKNKNVFSDIRIAPVRGLGAHITEQLISLRLSFFAEPFANRIQLSITNRNKEIMRFRRITQMHLFELNDGQP